MSEIKDIVMRLAPKLPMFIPTRMPYTYHHDYIRSKFPEKFKSRADVAASARGEDDDHLYAVGFLYLVGNESAADIMKIFSMDDMEDMYRLVIFAESSVKRFIDEVQT